MRRCVLSGVLAGSPQGGGGLSARRVVAAIDGPAAAGKSSTAREVARRLGYRHVDSGSLYRAATAARLRAGGEGGAWTESSVLEAAAGVALRPTALSFEPLIGGESADPEIRGADVTRHVSLVAQMPAVRLWVNDRVRDAARDHDIVVDGRDMGTVVFPDAAVKVFLIADTWERARRRVLQRTGVEGTREEIAREVERLVHRDALDATQSAPAPDAVIVDTTHIGQEEQIERIVALVRAAVH
jgi:cytidylate kinase